MSWGGGGGGGPTRSLLADVWTHKPWGFTSSKLGVTSPITVRFRVNTRVVRPMDHSYTELTFHHPKQDFPRQSHSVDAPWGLLPVDPTSNVLGPEKGKSDLGLVIDIAQLFSSNVPCSKCGGTVTLTHSQNHSAVIVPGKWGHLRIQCGRSVVKKIRPLPNYPR